MSKKIYIPLMLCAMCASVIGCNKSDDTEYEVSQSSGVAVTAFSLNNNSDVLDSLSNVYFSIDLLNGRIFNADSLPYGTDVSRLVTTISTPSTASKADLRFHDSYTDRDTTINYLTNSTDSIDFSKGPAILTVVSENGMVTKDYTISVNVHQVKADTLAWYSIQTAQLPTSFAHPDAQYTAVLSGVYYTLTGSNGHYCVATTSTPDQPDWQTAEVAFPFTPAVETLRASSDALYILDTDGRMYTSTDFSAWTATGQTRHYLYGAYGSDIMGSVRNADGSYQIASYPSGQSWTAPAQFPVDNTSLPASFSVPMGYAAQMVIAGGRRADGTLNDLSWGFDGTNWASTSLQAMPEALQCHTMIPYILVDTPSSTWTPQQYPVLMIMGGIKSDGSLNEDVYYSRDWGMNWALAPETVQLPEDIPAFYNAPAYIYYTVMHASRSQYWSDIHVNKIPAGARYLLSSTGSRAVAPITEWTCPAIYVFGGRDASNNTLNTLWRAVITEFTFKPVQ